MALQYVVRPPIVKPIWQLKKVLEEWEMKVIVLNWDCQEKIGEQMKFVIIGKML